MHAVCALDLGARPAVLRELNALAHRLRADLAVEAVYLFGSVARGTEHEGSDIDLLVVADFPGRSLDFIGQVTSRTELPVEPIVIRPATLARRLRDRHPLFTRIMADAVPLL